MIDCRDFYNCLKENKISFFSGVPDSLLKNFCAYLDHNVESSKHIIAANEGNAIALASGHYLATGNIPMVYMQNSGLGNSLNPLVSLTAKEVYGIPILLMIGYRGEPGVHDEPQHEKQGAITLSLLEIMGIPYEILSSTTLEFKKIVNKALIYMREHSSPYALVIRKNAFEQYQAKDGDKLSEESNGPKLSRENAIKYIASNLDYKLTSIFSTTGKISRELYEYRIKVNGEVFDFLNVGSMGHVSQMALGASLEKPSKEVYCFDGDGAMIMHMGGLGIIGQYALKNYKHIVFNNGAHDSVGGQETVGHKIDFLKIAEGCGYKNVYRAQNLDELKAVFIDLKNSIGPSLLEIVVAKGSRKDLVRPASTPKDNKISFIRKFRS